MRRNSFGILAAALLCVTSCASNGTSPSQEPAHRLPRLIAFAGNLADVATRALYSVVRGPSAADSALVASSTSQADTSSAVADSTALPDSSTLDAASVDTSVVDTAEVRINHWLDTEVFASHEPVRTANLLPHVSGEPSESAKAEAQEFAVASGGRIAPAITLPKRLWWGMEKDRCVEELASQGIQGDELLSLRWYGQPGWHHISTSWRTPLLSGVREPSVQVELYFDPSNFLQAVTMTAFADSSSDDYQEALAALPHYAEAVHSGLGQKYGRCRRWAPGHECTWRDELGFWVTFMARLDPSPTVSVTYTSALYRKAARDQDEF